MKIKTHYTDGTIKLKRTNGSRGDWSRERTATPSSEIARRISELEGAAVSKNACCGKARRLGLLEKPNACRHPDTSAWRSAISVRAWETRIANGTNRRFSR